MGVTKDGLHVPDTDIYFPAQGFQTEHLDIALGYVKKFSVALDVGAHVGSWTKLMAERFKTVYAFEPAPDSFECLKKNVGHLDSVRLYNVAVGEASGVCTIVEDITRPGNTGSRFVSPAKGKVNMIHLDSLGLTRCDFLKIDVEGFELPVLKGAKHLLWACKPVISMEVKTFHGRYRWGKFSAQSFLMANGYKEVAHHRPDKVFIYG